VVEVIPDDEPILIDAEGMFYRRETSQAYICCEHYMQLFGAAAHPNPQIMKDLEVIHGAQET
jgi:hypothetical protein